MKSFLIAVGILAATTSIASARTSRSTIEGGWRCVNVCVAGMYGAPTALARRGGEFLFRNEVGTIGRGAYAGGRTIHIPDWWTWATVAPNNRMITFYNGSVWVR